jgi:SAM-dependent methyltransferase
VLFAHPQQPADPVDPPPGKQKADAAPAIAAAAEAYLPAGNRADGVRIVDRVLQRMAHPLAALREIAAAMPSGGCCVVSVPRLDTLAQHRDPGFCLDGRKNLVAFTEPALRGLLARAGLEHVATLNELDRTLTRGRPLRLHVLARKVERPRAQPDPAAALEPVIAAMEALRLEASIDVHCPACDSDRTHVIERWRLTGGAHATSCDECGLLFVHPQPTAEALAAHYTPEGYGAWKASGVDKEWAVEPAERRIKQRPPGLFHALDAYFPTLDARGARLLDFGCGPGAWLDRFKRRGWDTYGIEPCTDAAFDRHKQLTAVPSQPEFDLVFLYHVLEHLPRPLDTLRELAGALRTGGYLFVSVPRLDALSIHHEVGYCLQPLHHIVAFTDACLRGLLARAGLEVVASLSDLPHAFDNGLPTKLQVLARKPVPGTVLFSAPANLADALEPVIDAYLAAVRRKRA